MLNWIQKKEIDEKRSLPWVEQQQIGEAPPVAEQPGERSQLAESLDSLKKALNFSRAAKLRDEKDHRPILFTFDEQKPAADHSGFSIGYPFQQNGTVIRADELRAGAQTTPEKYKTETAEPAAVYREEPQNDQQSSIVENHETATTTAAAPESGRSDSLLTFESEPEQAGAEDESSEQAGYRLVFDFIERPVLEKYLQVNPCAYPWQQRAGLNRAEDENEQHSYYERIERNFNSEIEKFRDFEHSADIDRSDYIFTSTPVQAAPVMTYELKYDDLSSVKSGSNPPSENKPETPSYQAEKIEKEEEIIEQNTTVSEAENREKYTITVSQQVDEKTEDVIQTGTHTGSTATEDSGSEWSAPENDLEEVLKPYRLEVSEEVDEIFADDEHSSTETEEEISFTESRSEKPEVSDPHNTDTVEQKTYSTYDDEEDDFIDEDTDGSRYENNDEETDSDIQTDYNEKNSEADKIQASTAETTVDHKKKAEIASESNTERASITPLVAVSKQYTIPFSLLKTDKNNLKPVDPKETQAVIQKLEETLQQFGIDGRVVGIQRGPIITRYELKMAPGIKVSRILGLTDELAMALEALRVRIEAPIPGRSTVGIEIPNKNRARVLLGDILNDEHYREFEGNLALPFGKDIAGNIVLEDLSKMPHLLIAGATGSGKSVTVNSFITSLILNRTPDDVRFLLIDPKLVELSHYNDIPHLLHPVITDPQKAVLALNWAVEEMERRYEDLAEMRVRDIRSYNSKIKTLNKKTFRSQNPHPPMPYIMVLIDELGDLMMVAGKEVEASIIRLSQKARAVGIHLILATQRPSVDVITALIKANCPARIALQVAQKTDSRTILDSNGAEQLLGQGDALFRHPSRAQLIRVQAPLVEDEEVEEIVKSAKKTGKPEYITLEDPRGDVAALDNEDEELFDEAWNIIKESGKASASYLQRRLRIGYNRAARLIEAFEARGYVGPQIGSKPREILI